MLLGGALGPWITGVSYDATGSNAPAFSVAIGLSGFSALAIWRAARARCVLLPGASIA
jgi:cyanate permease